jgi:predicted transcriptional regulator
MRAFALRQTLSMCNVHADIARLIDLGLVERNGDNAVEVKCDTVAIRMELAQAA